MPRAVPLTPIMSILPRTDITSPAVLLRRVLGVLKERRRWMHGGMWNNESTATATRCCLLGALDLVSGGAKVKFRSYDKARNAIVKALVSTPGTRSTRITEFNDDRYRVKHADILALLRKAIRIASAT